MAPMTRAARGPEPDADIPNDEPACWLLRQERAETRAALAAADLL